MQSIFTSLVYFLCFLTTMVEGLTRYQTTPPSDVTVIHIDNPSTIWLGLYAENGGYYLKNMDDEVVAITADNLCMELDVAFASIDAGVVGDDSGFEDGGSGSLGGANVTKRNICQKHRKS
ncbi:hypothetical protein N7467_006145 [Penicillium canescens]|nr:hypothetical protein N7467_006145 [Penicillium canescens]